MVVFYVNSNVSNKLILTNRVPNEGTKRNKLRQCEWLAIHLIHIEPSGPISSTVAMKANKSFEAVEAYGERVLALEHLEKGEGELKGFNCKVLNVLNKGELQGEECSGKY